MNEILKDAAQPLLTTDDLIKAREQQIAKHRHRVFRKWWDEDSYQEVLWNPYVEEEFVWA